MLAFSVASSLYNTSLYVIAFILSLNAIPPGAIPKSSENCIGLVAVENIVSIRGVYSDTEMGPTKPPTSDESSEAFLCRITATQHYCTHKPCVS